MAGNRQQSRFLALVSSYDRLKEESAVAADSENASALQYLKTLDSVETKQQQLQTSIQQLYVGSGIQNFYKWMLDFGAAFVNNLNEMGKIGSIPVGAISTIATTFINVANIVQHGLMKLFVNILNKFKAAQKQMTDAQNSEEQTRTANSVAAANQEEVILHDKVAQFENAEKEKTEIALKEEQKRQDLAKYGKLDEYSKDLKLTDADEKDIEKVLSKKKGKRKRKNELSEERDSVFEDISNVNDLYDTKEMINDIEESDKKLNDSLKQIPENVEENAENIQKSTSSFKEKVEKHSQGISLALNGLSLVFSTFATQAEGMAKGVLNTLSSTTSYAAMGLSMGGFKGMAIGAIVGLVAGIFSNWNTLFESEEAKLERLKKDAEDKQNAFFQASSETRTLDKQIQELRKLEKARYSSAEAEEAYYEAANKLADTYPDLISNLDSAGNATVNLDLAEQKLAETRKEGITAALESAKANIRYAKTQSENALKEYKNSINPSSDPNAAIAGGWEKMIQINQEANLKKLIQSFYSEILKTKLDDNINLSQDDINKSSEQWANNAIDYLYAEMRDNKTHSFNSDPAYSRFVFTMLAQGMINDDALNLSDDFSFLSEISNSQGGLTRWDEYDIDWTNFDEIKNILAANSTNSDVYTNFQQFLSSGEYAIQNPSAWKEEAQDVSQQLAALVRLMIEGVMPEENDLLDVINEYKETFTNGEEDINTGYARYVYQEITSGQEYQDLLKKQQEEIVVIEQQYLSVISQATTGLSAQVISDLPNFNKIASYALQAKESNVEKLSESDISSFIINYVSEWNTLWGSLSKFNQQQIQTVLSNYGNYTEGQIRTILGHAFGINDGINNDEHTIIDDVVAMLYENDFTDEMFENRMDLLEKEYSQLPQIVGEAQEGFWNKLGGAEKQAVAEFYENIGKQVQSGVITATAGKNIIDIYTQLLKEIQMTFGDDNVIREQLEGVITGWDDWTITGIINLKNKIKDFKIPNGADQTVLNSLDSLMQWIYVNIQTEIQSYTDQIYKNAQTYTSTLEKATSKGMNIKEAQEFVDQMRKVDENFSLRNLTEDFATGTFYYKDIASNIENVKEAFFGVENELAEKLGLTSTDIEQLNSITSSEELTKWSERQNFKGAASKIEQEINRRMREDPALTFEAALQSIKDYYAEIGFAEDYITRETARIQLEAGKLQDFLNTLGVGSEAQQQVLSAIKNEDWAALANIDELAPEYVAKIYSLYNQIKSKSFSEIEKSLGNSTFIEVNDFNREALSSLENTSFATTIKNEAGEVIGYFSEITLATIDDYIQWLKNNVTDVGDYNTYMVKANQFKYSNRSLSGIFTKDTITEDDLAKLAKGKYNEKLTIDQIADAYGLVRNEVTGVYETTDKTIETLRFNLTMLSWRLERAITEGDEQQQLNIREEMSNIQAEIDKLINDPIKKKNKAVEDIIKNRLNITPEQKATFKEAFEYIDGLDQLFVTDDKGVTKLDVAQFKTMISNGTLDIEDAYVQSLITSIQKDAMSLFDNLAQTQTKGITDYTVLQEKVNQLNEILGENSKIDDIFYFNETLNAYTYSIEGLQKLRKAYAKQLEGLNLSQEEQNKMLARMLASDFLGGYDVKTLTAISHKNYNNRDRATLRAQVAAYNTALGDQREELGINLGEFLSNLSQGGEVAVGEIKKFAELTGKVLTREDIEAAYYNNTQQLLDAREELKNITIGSIVEEDSKLYEILENAQVELRATGEEGIFKVVGGLEHLEEAYEGTYTELINAYEKGAATLNQRNQGILEQFNKSEGKNIARASMLKNSSSLSLETILGWTQYITDSDKQRYVDKLLTEAGEFNPNNNEFLKQAGLVYNGDGTFGVADIAQSITFFFDDLERNSEEYKDAVIAIHNTVLTKNQKHKKAQTELLNSIAGITQETEMNVSELLLNNIKLAIRLGLTDNIETINYSQVAELASIYAQIATSGQQVYGIAVDDAKAAYEKLNSSLISSANSLKIGDIITGEAAQRLAIIKNDQYKWREEYEKDGRIVVNSQEEYAAIIDETYKIAQEGYKNGTTSLATANNLFKQQLDQKDAKQLAILNLLKSSTNLTTDSIINFLTALFPDKEISEFFDQNNNLIPKWSRFFEQTGVDSYKLIDWNGLIENLDDEFGDLINERSEEVMNAYINYVKDQERTGPNAKELFIASTLDHMSRISREELQTIALLWFDNDIQAVEALVTQNADNTYDASYLKHKLDYNRNHEKIIEAYANDIESFTNSYTSAIATYMNSDRGSQATGTLKKAVQTYLDNIKDYYGPDSEIFTADQLLAQLDVGGLGALQFIERTLLPGQSLTAEQVKSIYRGKAEKYKNALNNITAGPGEIVDEITAQMIEAGKGDTKQIGENTYVVLQSTDDLVGSYDALLDSMRKSAASIAEKNAVVKKKWDAEYGDKKAQAAIDALSNAAGMTYDQLGTIFENAGLDLDAMDRNGIINQLTGAGILKQLGGNKVMISDFQGLAQIMDWETDSAEFLSAYSSYQDSIIKYNQQMKDGVTNELDKLKDFKVGDVFNVTYFVNELGYELNAFNDKIQQYGLIIEDGLLKVTEELDNPQEVYQGLINAFSSLNNPALYAPIITSLHDSLTSMISTLNSDIQTYSQNMTIKGDSAKLLAQNNAVWANQLENMGYITLNSIEEYQLAVQEVYTITKQAFDDQLTGLNTVNAAYKKQIESNSNLTQTSAKMTLLQSASSFDLTALETFFNSMNLLMENYIDTEGQITGNFGVSSLGNGKYKITDWDEFREAFLGKLDIKSDEYIDAYIQYLQSAEDSKINSREAILATLIPKLNQLSYTEIQTIAKTFDMTVNEVMQYLSQNKDGTFNGHALLNYLEYDKNNTLVEKAILDQTKTYYGNLLSAVQTYTQSEDMTLNGIAELDLLQQFSDFQKNMESLGITFRNGYYKAVPLLQKGGEQAVTIMKQLYEGAGQEFSAEDVKKYYRIASNKLIDAMGQLTSKPGEIVNSLTAEILNSVDEGAAKEIEGTGQYVVQTAIDLAEAYRKLYDRLIQSGTATLSELNSVTAKILTEDHKTEQDIMDTLNSASSMTYDAFGELLARYDIQFTEKLMKDLNAAGITKSLGGDKFAIMDFDAFASFMNWTADSDIYLSAFKTYRDSMIQMNQEAEKQIESEVNSLTSMKGGDKINLTYLNDKISKIAYESMDTFVEKYGSYLGNVNMSNRPIISPEKMVSEGWDIGGDYATIFGQSYTFEDLYNNRPELNYLKGLGISATPIRKNGIVLSPDQMQRYIEKLVIDGQGDVNKILELDKKRNNILLDVVKDDTITLEQLITTLDQRAIELHNAQEAWDNLTIDQSDEDINNWKRYSPLELLQSQLLRYGAILQDGVLTLQDDANIAGTIQTIINFAEQIPIMTEEELATLQDSLDTLFSSLVSALQKGIQGTLNHTEALDLKKQASQLLGIDLDFRQTNDGLKIANYSAEQLYLKLKAVDDIHASILHKDLAESYQKAGGPCENIRTTMGSIKELNDKVTNGTDERNQILKAQLSIYQDIARQQLNNAESYNFMNEKLPDYLQGPVNYWNSVGSMFEAINGAAKNGYMGVQDFYNVINELNNMAKITGQSMQLFGHELTGNIDDVTQLLIAASDHFSLVNDSSAKGLQVDMKDWGQNFLAGAKGMEGGIEEGIKAMASSQIDMLDAMISMLEVIVAMENLGDVDVNKNNTIDLSELFVDYVEGGDAKKYTTQAKEASKEILGAVETNKDLEKGLEQFKIGEYSIMQILKDIQDNGIKNLDLDSNVIQAVMDALYQAYLSGDYDLDNLAESIWSVLDEKLLDGMEFTIGENKVLYFGTNGHYEIQWDTKEMEEKAETLAYNNVKDLREDYRKALSKANKTKDDWKTILFVQGEIEIETDKNGKPVDYVVDGKHFTNEEDAMVAAFAKRYGFDLDDPEWQIDQEKNRTKEVKVGNDLDYTITLNSNGVTYQTSDGTYKGETLNGLISAMVEGIEDPTEKSQETLKLKLAYGIVTESSSLEGKTETDILTVTNNRDALKKLFDDNKSNNDFYQWKNDHWEVDLGDGVIFKTNTKVTEGDQFVNQIDEAVKQLQSSGQINVIKAALTEAFSGDTAITIGKTFAQSFMDGFTEWIKAHADEWNKLITGQVEPTVSEDTAFDLGKLFSPDTLQSAWSSIESFFFGGNKSETLPTTTPISPTPEASPALDIAQQVEAINQLQSVFASLVPIVVENRSIFEALFSTLSAMPREQDHIVQEFNETLSQVPTDVTSRISALNSEIGSLGSRVEDCIGRISNSINNLPNDKTIDIKAKIEVTAQGGKVIEQNPLFGRPVSIAGARAKGTNTLMGELGPELWVSDGHYYVAGQNGAEFVNLPDDAIVFNHKQTKRLLSSGHTGRGTAITNENNAIAHAAGTTGPAMASASAVLAALKQIRAMWQAMLSADLNDLGQLAGMGGGSGGGGGSPGGGGGGGGGGKANEINNGYIADLERWYNLLRQIEKLEKQISYEEKLRTKINSDLEKNGRAYYESQKRSLEYLDEEIARSRELSSLQKDYYDARRQDLAESNFGKIFTFNENGLMQLNDQATMANGDKGGLFALAKINATNPNGSPVYTAREQYNILKEWGFEEQMKYDNSGKALKKTDSSGKENENYYTDAVKAFWDKFNGWKEELDSLYDSYNDKLSDILDKENARNAILKEIIDNQLSVEQAVLKAIEDREQKIIDELQKDRDALEESSTKFIDGLNDQLSKEQQQAKDDKSDAELLKLQRQLAILQRSGGSASQIANLQKQISEQQQQQYFNEQKEQIDAIKQASDREIERLDAQIQLLTDTLEYQKQHGLLWEEVYNVMSKSEAEIADFIMGNNSEWASKSGLQTHQDYENLKKEIQEWVAARDDQQAKKDEQTRSWDTYVNAMQNQYKDVWTLENVSEAKRIYEETYAKEDDSNKAAAAADAYLKKKLKEYRDAHPQSDPYQQTTQLNGSGGNSSNSGGNSGGGSSSSNKKSGGNSNSSSSTKKPATPSKKTEPKPTTGTIGLLINYPTKSPSDSNYVKQQSARITVNKGTHKASEFTNRIKSGYKYSMASPLSVTINGGDHKTMTIVAVPIDNKKKVKVLEKQNKIVKGFSTGGMVEDTGLAMLHGTKTKPEAVLNPEQTKIWKEDIMSNKRTSLTSLLSNFRATLLGVENGEFTANNNNNNNGITIEKAEVHMNVASIANDYDAKRAGEKALEEMIKIARKSGTQSIRR